MTEEQNIMKEENKHLSEIQQIIEEQLQSLGLSLDKNREEIIRQKRYLWENIYEMDPKEIAANLSFISQDQNSYEFRESKKRLLLKLKDNPYFARIDFVYQGESEAEALYIGLGGLRKKEGLEPLIYDWRAPISSMYYDFDLGEAYYEAPMGKVFGKIKKKRQIKIRKGHLEYALDSDFKIDDEILQRELSGNASTKMRNIVATIQKEQNTIVRDQTSPIMMVQGVAGSGKTSIALHRIAFLLYQNRKSLHSSEILILSPNHIFADYISNVLPELGEENILEVSFDEIAEHELKEICKFEPKYAQIEYQINAKSEEDKRLQRIRFKNSFTFLKELRDYVTSLEEHLLTFSSCTFRGDTISAEQIQHLYQETFSQEPLFGRLDKIAERIADIYESDHNTRISATSRNELAQTIYEMAKSSDILELYVNFIQSLTKYPVPSDDYILENFRNRLPYEDVFPLILLKYMLFPKQQSRFDRIKHIIVDEMQDYSMIQYALLQILFHCKMTILGDINQGIEKREEMLNLIQKIFCQKITVIKMLKTYRSTYEISEFCQKLGKITDIQSFERHGKAPMFTECGNYTDMVQTIQSRMEQASFSENTTFAIICKTSAAANKLYSALDKKYRECCSLIDENSTEFHEGIIITNAYLAKGLEFDCVILSEVTDKEYSSERDRQILYIAATRALHELEILYFGKESKFISEIK